jgi:hypothetical protein
MGDHWMEPPTPPEEARALIDSSSVEHYELADSFQARATIP